MTLDHPVFAHVTEVEEDKRFLLTPKPKLQCLEKDEDTVLLGEEDVDMEIANAAGLELGIFDERYVLHSNSLHDAKVKLPKQIVWANVVEFKLDLHNTIDDYLSHARDKCPKCVN